MSSRLPRPSLRTAPLPLLAAVMALANLGGSLAGTWLALKHGSGFIRQIFLLVVAVLIVKFAWDTVRLL